MVRTARADGFIIQSATPDNFTRFVDQVVPLLQQRGLFRREYPGYTLRESLALDYPANRYADARQPAEETAP